MAEEMMDKKADADAGEKLDQILKHMDAMSKRMDSLEAADKARKDSEEEEKKKMADGAAEGGHEDDDIPEEEEEKADEDEEMYEGKGKPKEVVADKKRKDSAKKMDEDEEEEMEDKADAEEKEKMADAMSEVARRIADVEKMLPKQLSDADYAAMADAQARADSVLQGFGESAPRPLNGENLTAYRRRLARKLQAHSKSWKDANIMAIHDAASFEIIENQIYNDASEAALRPVDIPVGTLREITRKDITGRNVTTFVGDPAAWMAPMSGYTQRAKFNSIQRN